MYTVKTIEANKEKYYSTNFTHRGTTYTVIISTRLGTVDVYTKRLSYSGMGTLKVYGYADFSKKYSWAEQVLTALLRAKREDISPVGYHVTDTEPCTDGRI